MASPVHWITTLFIAAVAIGAGYQVLSQPKKANALVDAGASSVVGVKNALEGKKGVA